MGESVFKTEGGIPLFVKSEEDVVMSEKDLRSLSRTKMSRNFLPKWRNNNSSGLTDILHCDPNTPLLLIISQNDLTTSIPKSFFYRFPFSNDDEDLLPLQRANAFESPSLLIYPHPFNSLKPNPTGPKPFCNLGLW